jgi:SAM-dependent methyltransferase
MGFDFSFDDRVARRYKGQREHPPAVSEQIGQAIASAIGEGGLALEIGVGTGRIARPVAAASKRLVGLDISAEMLAEAEEKPPGLFLIQGDMHHLPLPDDSVDAVLAVHVLHLATDWRQVIAEAARVLRPGGVFIRGDDWVDPESVFGRLRDALRQKAIALSPQTRPPAAGVSKQQALAEWGGTEATTVTAAEWTTWLSPQERLEAIANRMDNESWFLPQSVFDRLLPQLRDFAAETWPDLEQRQPVHRRFLLQVTRGSW